MKSKIAAYKKLIDDFEIFNGVFLISLQIKFNSSIILKRILDKTILNLHNF